MSVLSEALADLAQRGILERVTVLHVDANSARVEMLPKHTPPERKLPGEGQPDEDILFDASRSAVD